jgi:TonB family protein
MPETWKQWIGQVVDGQFPLHQYLGGSERSGVFLTERRHGQAPEKAAIKIVTVLPHGEVQLSRWQQAANLSHPNLIRLFEMGRCEINGVPFLYVVMEYAPENLNEVLAARALVADEASAMLEPLLDVLEFLHGSGFVHGHIKPANILANGEQLKLSSDGVCRTGEPVSGSAQMGAYEPPEYRRGVIPVTPNVSPAGDVWSLGVTLVDVLARKIPAEQPPEEQQAILQNLPQPFQDIARNCLARTAQQRWTIAQIKARFAEGAQSANQVAAPAVSAIPPAGSPLNQTAKAGPHRPPYEVAKRIPRQTVEQAAPPHVPARQGKRRGYAVPLLLGLVLFAIFGGSRLLRRDSGTSQTPASSSETPTGAPEPNVVTRPQPPQQPAPDLESPSAAASARAPQEASGARTAAQPQPPGPARAVAPETAAIPVGGDVAARVLPRVPQKARDTIRGTITVRVRAAADQTGRVEATELAAAGPSRYFARLAREAAMHWKFKPPTVGGRNVPSHWIIQFDYTRRGTTATPKQETP